MQQSLDIVNDLLHRAGTIPGSPSSVKRQEPTLTMAMALLSGLAALRSLRLAEPAVLLR